MAKKEVLSLKEVKTAIEKLRDGQPTAFVITDAFLYCTKCQDVHRISEGKEGCYPEFEGLIERC